MHVRDATVGPELGTVCVSGCATSTSSASQPSASAAIALKSVSVPCPNSVDALRTTLQRTLESKSLIAPDGDFDLQVVVDDIRVRSTFNAVMWGFMAGDDHLDGTATVLRKDGQPAGRFGHVGKFRRLNGLLILWAPRGPSVCIV